MATLEGAKRKFESGIEYAVRNGEYAKGMARFFGVSPTDIAGSDPVKAWNSAFSNPKDKAEKWAAKLREAFLG